MWMHTVVYQLMQVCKLDLGILVTTSGTQFASCICMKPASIRQEKVHLSQPTIC